MRPARTMLTRSADASTSERMWLDSRTVRPSARTRASCSWNTCSISGSRPDVGSSRTSSGTSRRERGDERDLLPVALGVGAALLGRVELERVEQLVSAAGCDARRAAGRAGR